MILAIQGRGVESAYQNRLARAAWHACIRFFFILLERVKRQVLWNGLRRTQCNGMYVTPANPKFRRQWDLLEHICLRVSAVEVWSLLQQGAVVHDWMRSWSLISFVGSIELSKHAIAISSASRKFMFAVKIDWTIVITLRAHIWRVIPLVIHGE